MPKKLQVLGPFAKQPDYNQNDETQIDYIKNRPFYDTRATEEVEITFDGTLDGKEYIQIDDEVYLVKISDNAPEKESLIGATIRVFYEGTIEEYTITKDMLNVVSDDLYMIFETFVAINDTTFNGMSLSKGIWTVLELDVYYMTYLKITKETGELKKIDEKYLQDPDWENITNKPFYDVIETKQFTYTNVSTSGQGAAGLGSGKPFIEGETYTVTVNGESTEIVATDLGDGVLRLLYSGSSSTSKNIFYNEYTEGYGAWTWWSSGATVTIEGPFRDLKQIEKKYIPETVESIDGKTGDLSLSDFVLLQPYTIYNTNPKHLAYQYIKSSGVPEWWAYTSNLFKRSSDGNINVFNSSPVGNGVYITSYKRTERSDTEPDEYAIVPSIYTGIITKGVELTYPYFAHVMPQLDGKVVEDDWRCLTNIKYVKDYAIPTPETASVGQTIVVKAVDENGKPTEWESADMPEIVQPDYNQNDETASDYIKNRPFYEHIITERDMIPETSIEATTQSGDLWYQSGLSITILHASDVVRLSTVKVYFDGEVYEQVPIESTYIGGGTYLITIGNTENYPFKVDNGVAYFTTSGTHSLRVCKIIDPETEIITIPMKYLPLEEVELLGTQQRIPTGYAVWNYVTTKCLTKNNTTSYTPTSDYHPATKKYVDDVKQYVNDYTIPIPSVTEEDNNKILSVVDGKPAWITINNAEGVAY